MLRRCLCRYARYWPPPPESRSSIVNLGTSKDAFVFNQKSDVTGELEPSLCITLPDMGERLVSFTEEELLELEKLAPRISSYFDLWEEKETEKRDKVVIVDDLRD